MLSRLLTLIMLSWTVYFVHISSAISATGSINVDGAVVVGTCNFTGSSAITVPLGDVKFTDFSGVGSTTATHNFTIELTCQDEANVYLTMSATQEGSLGSSGVLALQGSGSATGVGVQLLKDGNPFPLNSQQQIALSQSSGLTINMAARYYQSAVNMVAGTGNAVIDFTVDYL